MQPLPTTFLRIGVCLSVFALTSVSAFQPLASWLSAPGSVGTNGNTNLASPALHAKNDGKDDSIDDETFIDETVENPARRNLIINAVSVGLLGASGVSAAQLYQTNVYTPSNFKRLPTTQFIAALGDPKATSGSGAEEWGLWRLDPGPRGVWLRQYEEKLAQRDNMAPAGWKFDLNDWWVEEHGLIMEAPEFPLSAGRYLVTGGRMTTTGLTVDAAGNWKLDEGTLYDVTHLPCRSARYSPAPGQNGSPLTANQRDFPVSPGAIMPSVEGCNKQDYAVLFLIGKAA